MHWESWFVFDLGNVIVKIAYERVISSICADSDLGRDGLVDVLEKAGGYRDLERGGVTFEEFHEFLRDRGGYRAPLSSLRAIWLDFFDGPVEGIEEVLDRVREQYRVAFLSNSNQIHAELIPRQYAVLFRKDDRFIFSHQLKLAKPDPAIFVRALSILGALPRQTNYVDDLVENVIAARSVGINSIQFTNSFDLLHELERQELLPPSPHAAGSLRA
jgi:haloacid dehalogenase superfamily, subfamily IA, variant 3 with third motif having DD or ED